MEHLNKLASEIEELRRTLEKKQEEYNRLTSDLTLDQNTNSISKPTQITNSASINIYNPIDERHYDTKQQSELHTNGQGVFNNGGYEKSKVQVGEKLPTWAIERYSRQILLPEIGVHGQEKLCAARVLIVGAGGLGCPAGTYLAGAGVGEIGIVDYDTVDVTNIHRQFLHSEGDQLLSKAESAANSLRSMNSRIKVTPYDVQLSSENAVQIASQYDVVLDCTDNVPTRYLLNDLCVLTKLPLISGSALKMEGQLTIYGYRAENNSNEQDGTYRGPCYRCVFPTPPPPEAVGSCSANGVAGPLPGVIGALQALEAIKFIVGHTHTKLLVERMLIFDGEDMTFRTVKLRPRSAQCAACSENATISQLIDYEMFCKAQAKEKRTQETPLKTELRQQEKEKRMTGQSYYGFRTANGTKKWANGVDSAYAAYQEHAALVFNLLHSGSWSPRVIQDLDLQILPPEHRVSALQLSKQINCNQRHLLVDVRSEAEFDMCRIDGSANYPIEKFGWKLEKLLEEIRNLDSVTFVCRRGNDSQIATQKVLEAIEKEHRHKVNDLAGGLHAWAKEVDTEFPIY